MRPDPEPRPSVRPGSAVSVADPGPVDEPAHRGWPPGFAEGRAGRAAALVLASLRGILCRDLGRLAWREGTAAATLAAIAAGQAGSRQDRAVAVGLDVDALAGRVADAGARMVVPGDEEYVAGIEDLHDPPVALFVRGGSLADPAPRVAIVGARASTPYGREVARALGRGLANIGCIVVSGGARGIDTASHEGALAVEGATVAVLGCGIDRAYPGSNRILIERIVRSGSVVSEYPPGVPALPHHFPARNRLVAALSAGVVVVEGAKGSGSLITAELALDLGRPVMAVPGPINGTLSEAPHQLIRDGAALVRGVDDVIADVGLTPLPATSADGEGEGGVAPVVPRGLSATEARVFRALAGPTLAEDVARAANLDVRMAVATLLGLELRGLVQSVGGRYMMRPGVRG